MCMAILLLIGGFVWVDTDMHVRGRLIIIIRKHRVKQNGNENVTWYEMLGQYLLL